LYPRENGKLAEQILSCGGALISEFPTGAAELSDSQSHH
jgi:predicted Rossmann fold nucleotide-binding protein DprA/Smf involved in DNA uptake